jgi:hypothetical protein
MKRRELPVATTSDELEVFISKEWSYSKKWALGFLILFILALVQSIYKMNKPILELSEMQVSEGELINIVSKKGYNRVYAPYLVIKQKDGSSFKADFYFRNSLDSFIGKTIKVWSEESCNYILFGCTQVVNQVQYKSLNIVDYKKFVKTNIKNAKKSNFGLFITFALPLFFFLVAIGFLDSARNNEKKMRMYFNRNNGE